MIAQVVEIVTERGSHGAPSGPWAEVALIAVLLLGYAVWLAFVYSRNK